MTDDVRRHLLALNKVVQALVIPPDVLTPLTNVRVELVDELLGLQMELVENVVAAEVEK